MAFNESSGAAARVRFTEFHSPHDPMLQAWARFRHALAGPAPSHPHSGEPTSADSGLWRLLASNNRELGRSFLLYRRYDAARSHVEQLQSRPDELTIELVHGPLNGSRGWVIVAADVPVMTCSRWYSSTSAGAHAAAGALASFRGAILADAPDRSDASGRYRRPVRLESNALP